MLLQFINSPKREVYYCIYVRKGDAFENCSGSKYYSAKDAEEIARFLHEKHGIDTVVVAVETTMSYRNIIQFSKDDV